MSDTIGEEDLDKFLKATAESRPKPRRKPKDPNAANFEMILSKKDSKIQSLIASAKDLRIESRRLDTENSQLLKERDESQLLIDELRGLVGTFEKQLEAAKVMHSELHVNRYAEEELSSLKQELATTKSDAEKFRKEVNILTRALAVNSVESGADGEAALERGQEIWAYEELKSEVERLRLIEAQYALLQSVAEQADLRVEELKSAHAQLTSERLSNDKLRHQLVVAEGRLVSAVDEREKMRMEISQLEQKVAEAGSSRMRDVDDREVRIKELTRKLVSAENEGVSRDVNENRLKQKISQLEAMILERDARVQELQVETLSLRSSVAGLDSEIRSLASSLDAEMESNENLTGRLEKLDSQLMRAETEISTLKRREKDLMIQNKDLEDKYRHIDQMRKELMHAQAVVKDRESHIVQLEEAKDMYRRTAASELERLRTELAVVTNQSMRLDQQYRTVAREKEKIKSLLANDTMSRLGKILSESRST